MGRRTRAVLEGKLSAAWNCRASPSKSSELHRCGWETVTCGDVSARRGNQGMWLHDPGGCGGDCPRCGGPRLAGITQKDSRNDIARDICSRLRLSGIWGNVLQWLDNLFIDT